MIFEKIFIIVLLELGYPKFGTTNTEHLIWGGSVAPKNAYPYSTFLDVNCHPSWICGGTILNQKIILTAAHCLSSCDLKSNHKVEAFAGHEELSKMTMRREIIDLIIHSGFDEETIENDIALALLSFSLIFGNNVKRVIIKGRFPQNFEEAVITGWGTLDEIIGQHSEKLMFLRQKVQSNNVCAKTGGVHPGMLCAGSVRDSDPRPVDGDSGGGLIINNHEQIGLLSWNCKTYPSLAMYTNVTFYYSWIRTKAMELLCYNKG